MTEQVKQTVVYVKTKEPQTTPKEGILIKVLKEGEGIKGVFENVYAPSIEGYKDDLVLISEGTKYVFNMNTSLFKQLEWKGVLPGHEIEITFDGTLKSKEKGKKPMNLFKIQNITQPNVARKVSSTYKAIVSGTVTPEISDDELDD